MKLTKSQRSHVSTILGLVAAIANGWLNVDWSTWQLDKQHITPLIVSAIVAAGGYFTSINQKETDNLKN